MGYLSLWLGSFVCGLSLFILEVMGVERVDDSHRVCHLENNETELRKENRLLQP